MPNEENLIPGPKIDYSGRDHIVSAIKESLIDEYQDDEKVRHILCKVDDFEVTDEVRDHVVNKVARRVYESIFNTIKNELSKRRDVSINGFARFKVEKPSDLVKVCYRSPGMLHGEAMRPLFADDAIYSETRSASIKAGSWQGGGANTQYIRQSYLPAGTTSLYDEASATWYPVEKNGYWEGAGLFGIYNAVRVSAVGSDGITRGYEVGGLAIMRYVNRYTRPSEVNDDLDLIIEARGDELSQAISSRQSRGLTEEYLAENLGDRESIVPDEYAKLLGKSVFDLPQNSIKNEIFFGIPAENILEAYPKTVNIVRDYGGLVTYDIIEVKYEVFRAQFEYLKNYLIGRDSWIEPPRRGNRVVVDFRQDFASEIDN